MVEQPPHDDPPSLAPRNGQGRAGRGEPLTARERVLEAVLVLVDAHSEDDGAYRRAWNRLRSASLGWLLPALARHMRLLMRSEHLAELVRAASRKPRKRAATKRRKRRASRRRR